MKRIGHFVRMKQEHEKIVMLTAYDYPSAKMAEQAEVDIILVGDSLGMVVLGYESTIPVTINDMIRHTQAVKRGAKNTFTVTDMPFMSYHASLDDTMKNAARIVQEGGADALKLEGGDEVIEKIGALTRAGIPVMGHLGLTPQSVGVLGGYKIQGKTAEAARKLLQDAKLCEEAGAFALVLECVPQQAAAVISKELSIPVIGIGAGKETDGQVLVYHDVLQYGIERTASFVKSYADAGLSMLKGLSAYKEEVKTGIFPDQAHSFTMDEEEEVLLYGGIK